MLTDDFAAHTEVTDFIDASRPLDFGSSRIEQSPFPLREFGRGREYAFDENREQRDAPDEVFLLGETEAERLERAQHPVSIPTSNFFQRGVDVVRGHSEIDQMTTEDSRVPSLVHQLRGEELHLLHVRRKSYEMAERPGGHLFGDRPKGKLLEKRCAKGAVDLHP